MRSLIVLALITSTSIATAEPMLRIGIGAARTSQPSSLERDPSTTAGPSISLDVIPRREGFVIGAHFGWSASFNTYPAAGTPGLERNALDQLFEAHAMLEWHRGRVSLGASLGVDVIDSHGTYSLMNQGEASDRDTGIGARLHVDVDVASFSRGTLAVTGSAALSSLLAASGACNGSFSCAPQGTSIGLGVTFRPR